MRITYRSFLMSAAFAAMAVVPGSAQKSSGPKATYQMDVETTSGMGLGAMMGGGLGGLLGGGGGGANYSLYLELKSMVPTTVKPAKADHFFLSAAKMGKSVPLIGGVGSKSTPEDYEKPTGRILMFWGCHEKAPKGQPFIIDLAKMAPSSMPPIAMRPEQMERYTRSQRVQRENMVWWPNREGGGKQPKSGSTLRGDHRITSNFTPEVKFSLLNDYMGATKVSTSDKAGAIPFTWTSLPTATGYAAWAIAGMEKREKGGDIVVWHSSNNRDNGSVMGWLSPAEVQKQIGLKNVMPPSQTSCAIPAEVKKAGGEMVIGTLNAFGPEENFAFPPRPADPKAAWNIEWTAKARFHSLAMFMTGMDMGGENGGSGPAPAPRPKKPCKGPFGVPIPGTSC